MQKLIGEAEAAGATSHTRTKHRRFEGFYNEKLIKMKFLCLEMCFMRKGRDKHLCVKYNTEIFLNIEMFTSHQIDE